MNARNHLGLALAVLLASTAAHATSTATTQLKKKWNVSAFTLELLDTAPHFPRGDVMDALKSASSTWNATGMGTEIDIAYAKSGDLHMNPVARDGRNTVGVYPGAWPWPAQVGAVTITWTDDTGTIIEEVDLALNPAFAWTAEEDGNSGPYDLNNVLTHELGHSLGLPDIKDSREATMFYLILPGETLKRDLSHEDEAMLMKLYEGIDDPSPGCNAAGGETVGVAGIALALLAIARKQKNMNHRSAQ